MQFNKKYQFPMGKVKLRSAKQTEDTSLYQFPMGKVKENQEEKIASLEEGINSLWER